MRIALWICLAWLAFQLPVAATVVVYPEPAGLGPDDAARVSSAYRVSVIQDGERQESFVYEIAADATREWRHNICSFTTFSFDGHVTVEIQKLDGELYQSCRVYPTSARINPVYLPDNTIRFRLYKPGRKIAVIFDDDWTSHPLLIFGDELEHDPPTELDDPNLIHFGPGVHEVGRIRVSSGQTVYLAGGAYVKGYIDEEDLRNAVIRGRGILSAENLGGGGRGGINTIDVTGDNVGNLLVEGVTFIQSAHFACRLRGRNNVIRNIKVVGCWHPTTDGANVGTGGLIEDSFFKCDDDAIKLYESDTTVRRCVLWQMENGSCFQLGWQGQGGVRTNVYVHDIDIIRSDGTPRGDDQNRDNCAIIGGVSGTHRSSGYVFENIRAENVNHRLFSFNVPEGGEVSGFKIINFTADNWNAEHYHNEFEGNVHDIEFNNLWINGYLIRTPAQGKFVLKNGARDIRLTARP